MWRWPVGDGVLLSSMAMSTPDGLILDDEEWHELFGDHVVEVRPRKKPRGRVVKVLAALAIAGVLISGIPAAFDAFRSWTRLGEPASEHIDESEWGWLVSGVTVEPIDSPNVGGFVLRGPADGIIHIDERPWQAWALEDTMAHEIGHLVGFAAYGEGIAAGGGLDVEVWAECAAIANAGRHTDRDGADQIYRCTDAELEAYTTAISELGEVVPGAKPLWLNSRAQVDAGAIFIRLTSSAHTRSPVTVDRGSIRCWWPS